MSLQWQGSGNWMVFRSPQTQTIQWFLCFYDNLTPFCVSMTNLNSESFCRNDQGGSSWLKHIIISIIIVTSRWCQTNISQVWDKPWLLSTSMIHPWMNFECKSQCCNYQLILKLHILPVTSLYHLTLLYLSFPSVRLKSKKEDKLSSLAYISKIQGFK